MKTKVKICCIQSITEAEFALEYGAYAIGLVSKMPSGPGVISEAKIREIAKWAPPELKTVLLTALQHPQDIVEQHQFCGTDILQMVDSQKPKNYIQLRKKLTNIKLMQVIHVINESSIHEAIKVSEYVDYILLDSGNPNLDTKELGGTGRTHNWDLSKKIVDEVDIPVFLAGGLNPDNVAKAIDWVIPFGVDVCTGLRNDDKLDVQELEYFIKNTDK